MKTTMKQVFAGMMVLAAFSFCAPRASAAPPSEDKVVANLSSPKEGTVISALKDMEKNYPTSATGLPIARKLLSDPRNKVAREAAYMLGNVHADVSDDDLKNICVLLKSSDKTDVIDALKGLRGLKSQSTIPDILPLLQNPDNNIKRDACRTLKVIGNKSIVPSIQPLLSYPDDKVVQDAADAINTLKLKD